MQQIDRLLVPIPPHAQIQSEVALDSPVVLHIEAQVPLAKGQDWTAQRDLRTERVVGDHVIVGGEQEYPVVARQKHVGRALLIDFAAELDRMLALQHRRVVLQLVHVDDATLREGGIDAEAYAILRRRADQHHIGGAIRRGRRITARKRLLVEETAGPRKAEANLIDKNVAEISHPVQADLLAQSRYALPVADLNSVAEVHAPTKCLLVDVTPEEVVLRRQLEVEPARSFIIVEGTRNEARHRAELNWSASVCACRCARKCKSRGRVNLIGHQHILNIRKDRIARLDCVRSDCAFD